MDDSKCNMMTGFLFGSLLASILGIAFIFSIVGMLIGAIFIILAWIMFIISIVFFIMIMYNTFAKGQQLSDWCKINVFFFIIVLIMLIVSSVLTPKFETIKIEPVASNEEVN